MNKAFGANMAPADRRHHHRLVPLWKNPEPTADRPLRYIRDDQQRLIGWRCAAAECQELFTPNGGISESHVLRPGPRRRVDLMRRSFSHADRAALAGVVVQADA
jgi:hypothetical protein